MLPLDSNWVSDNILKLGDDKCHLMVFCDESKEAINIIANSVVKLGVYEKLLGCSLSKKLNFKTILQI